MGLTREKLIAINYTNMNKEQLLQELSMKVQMGEVSREEIMNRLSIPHSEGPKTNAVVSKNFLANLSATKMLYILGAAIVVIGIVIFFYQIWDDIGTPLRILVTLGLGFLITAIGSMLLKTKPTDVIGSVFHVIGGLLIPGGAMVMLYELDVIQATAWPITITFGIISLFYYLLNIVHKNVVLTFFAIANTTAFIYLFVQSVLDNSLYTNENLYAYLTMAIGLSYLLLSHSFKEGWNKNLTGILCFFGITGFLGAAFSQVFDSSVWQMIYFILMALGFYLSILMKSRSILVMSTIFLIAHVSYITDEYFADSLGWPISLVILGFVFIGLGYTSFAINKKYITN
jgi:hypothetical protein